MVCVRSIYYCRRNLVNINWKRWVNGLKCSLATGSSCPDSTVSCFAKLLSNPLFCFWMFFSCCLLPHLYAWLTVQLDTPLGVVKCPWEVPLCHLSWYLAHRFGHLLDYFPHLVCKLPEHQDHIFLILYCSLRAQHGTQSMARHTEWVSD